MYPDCYVSQPLRHAGWPAKNNVIMQPGCEQMCPQTFSHSRLVTNETSGFGQRSSATTCISKECTAKIPSHTGENILASTSSTLQRSPLVSSSVSNSQAGSTSCSFFGHNFSYFSSLFTHKQPNATPSGLYNLGNTCFINSTLQCLIWSSGFIEALPYVYGSQAYNDNTRLVRVLDDVVNLCHAFSNGGSDFKPVNVTELLRSISLVAPHLVAMPGSDEYQSQQDAAEFLLWLLNHLHGILRVHSGGKSGIEFVLSDTNISSLKRNKEICLATLQKSKSTDISLLREPLMNLSEVDWQLHWQQDSSTLYQLFLGQLIEARECQRCGKMSFSIEYFTLLPLPLPGIKDCDTPCTLKDCFQLFSCPEDMTQSNMITCSCMNGDEATLSPGKRLTLLSRPPRRMVIQLTRYSYDSARSMAVKNTISVRFATMFNLFPHTMSSVIGQNLHVQSMIYELQGFCVHSRAQSTSYGHYVAYCKASNGNWYYFDDDSVSIINNIETELMSTFVLRNAYLLFYSLQDS